MQECTLSLALSERLGWDGILPSVGIILDIVGFVRLGLFFDAEIRSVADPGFPRGGAPTYLFGQFFPKTA